MTALQKRMADLIRHEGPMTVERYMAMALGDPQHGYYMTRDPFGAQGDFTTAPEMSQIFGELLGLWCADLWLRAGQPPTLSLVELGPGRGTLMSDVLRATRAVQGFHDALHVTLIDMSPVLRDTQKKTLVGAHPRIDWAADVSSLPSLPTIVLANEFFDALPIRHYQKHEGHWRERLVGVDETDRLIFGLSQEPIAVSGLGGTDGDILEVSPITETIMTDVAAHVAQHGGAGLVIDYGYLQTGFGDTLQALKAHRPIHPLEHAGEADLTAHVNFQTLLHALRKAGAMAHGPIAQADLLERLGIATRTEALLRRASPEQAKDVHSAVARLTERTAQGMGHLFKALAFSHRDWPSPAGF